MAVKNFKATDPVLAEERSGDRPMESAKRNA
jgi:hypothetical protein